MLTVSWLDLSASFQLLSGMKTKGLGMVYMFLAKTENVTVNERGLLCLFWYGIVNWVGCG
jgi:hypothetical protein